MQPYTRTKLTEIRERKTKARSTMSAARKAIELAGDDAHAREVAQVALSTAQGEESLAAELEATILHQLSGVSDIGTGQTFLDDPGVVSELEQLANSSAGFGSLNLGSFMSAEDLMASIESGTWGGRTLAAASDVDLPDLSRYTAPYGIRSQLRRKLSILDLIPTAAMEGLAFTYVQEANPSGAPSGSDPFSSAVETAEGSLKSQSSIGLVDAEVRAQTIAHFYRMKRQQLADVAGLATTINSRLVYGVLRRLESQIIAGDGVGDNILGITHQPNVGNVVYVSGGLTADHALDGIVDVLNAEAEPNAVCVNPTDWGAALKAKSSGSGEYLNEVGPFTDMARVLWGVDIIPTTAMPVGTALVGDFSQLTLYVREGVNVRMSDSDTDAFTRNEVVALGECRAGVAVWQPAAFAVVHLA